MVLEMARAFIESDKSIAAICLGTQILISSLGLRGRMATCYKSIAVEMKRAGAHYVDEKVVVDDNLITLCKLANMPVFMCAIKQWISELKIAIP